jgi:hypothetical protein
MSDMTALDEFLHKWRVRWPEWSVAEVFLPASQRELAHAWLALRSELAEAAWGGEDPTPGHAKLGWWEEELQGWARGMRRHPLAMRLQKCPVDWQVLAAALPALRRQRAPEGDRMSALQALAPYAHAVASLSAAMFAAPMPAPTDAMAEALLAEWILWLPERGVPADGTDTASVLALPPLRQGARVERLQSALVRARLQRQRRHAQTDAVPMLFALFRAWRAARD